MTSAHETPRRPVNRAAKALAATALALAAGVAGAGIQAKLDKDPTTAAGMSQEKVEAIADRAAYNAVSAERLVDYYTKKGQRVTGTGESIGVMTFLNGTIVSPNSPSSRTEHRDLIVLNFNTDPGESVTLDAAGKFLSGAYLGVATTNEHGKLVVTSIPYDPESIFTPYDPTNPIITAQAYATVGKEGAAFMYVDDPRTGQQLMDPDGSPFSPTLVK